LTIHPHKQVDAVKSQWLGCSHLEEQQQHWSCTM